MSKHCTNLDCIALERDGVPAEYVDAFSECAECGNPLSDGERPAPTPVTYRKLVTVYVANDGTSAQLIRLALEAEDIPVTLAGENLANAVGELPATVLQVPIQVPPEHAPRAREIALGFVARS
jgi:hypothetical protein